VCSSDLPKRYIASVGGTGPTHSGIASGDLNGDGAPDIVAADSVGNSVSVLLNDGQGGLGTAGRFIAGGLPYSVITADLNGDRFLDVATANSRTDDISVLFGDGKGGLGLAVRYPSGLGPTDIVALDVNGDGALDLLSYYGNVSIHINNGAGVFTKVEDAVVGEPTGAIAIAMEVADFTGDGRPDIAVTYWPSGASSSVITQLINQGDGRFVASTPSYPLSGSTEAMRSADVDCNGTTDLVVPIAGGGLLVLPSKPNTGLGEPVKHEAQSGTNAVEFADFNGDGRVDMAVSIFEGDVKIIDDVCSSDLTLPDSSFATEATSESMVSPDLNRDGVPDLVVGTWFSPNIAVLFGVSQSK
jgi:hypothetical protein